MKAWANEHFPDHQLTKLEWIDDSSCAWAFPVLLQAFQPTDLRDTTGNLVYATPEIADAALTALTLPSHSPSALPPLTLRPAKPSPTVAPDVALSIRIARPTDRKERGARERSRYYLFHPEEDKGEIHERQRRRPRRRSDRNNSQERDYERRYYDSREHDRRRDRGEAAGYNEDMYDDDIGARDRRGPRQGSGGRSRSRSRGGRRARRTRSPSSDSYNPRDRDRERSRSPRRNRGRELFPDPPRREKKELFPETTRSEGRAVMDTVPAPQPVSTAPRNSNSDVDLFSEKMKQRKELFPESTKTSAFSSPEPRKELFPSTTSNSAKELFHSSSSTRNTTASPFAAPAATTPFASSSARSLADRITVPPKSLADRISFGNTDSKSDNEGGLQIKGTSRSGFGSDDLFAQKMMSAKGEGLLGGGGGRNRGASRRKAEDLFDSYDG